MRAMGASAESGPRRRGAVRWAAWIATFAATSLGGLLVLLARRPRGDRDWAEEFARTTTARFNPDGTVTLTNIRDWTYAPGRIRAKDWRDEVTVDPRAVTGVSFLLEPFSQVPAAGHTFLSFQFADGQALAFSVEARRRRGQKYSVAKGLFRAYELAYTWGTERDFVTRRVLCLGHPLRLYPLIIDPPLTHALFRDLAQETQVLSERPRFYNSLTENCTNALVHIVNRHRPGTLPWGASWHLPGYADEYLMKRGFIAVDGGSVEATQARHELGAHSPAVAAIARDPPEAFSAELRAAASSRTPGG